MKKTLIKTIILFLIVFALISCNDPIFFIVHEEIPILKPFIDGSPTNFVKYDGKLYVASGKQIFSYDGSSWSKWKKLDGRIGGLAATNSSLYALYLSNDTNDGRIRNCSSDSDLSLTKVQSIHASESDDVLFASTRNDSKYTISYKKGSSDFKDIATDYNSELRGVASDDTNYYLCVSGGIYYTDITLSNTSNLPVLGKGNDFTGIINLNDDYIAAITNDGKLFQIYKAEIKEAAKFSDSRYSTGALALWYRNNDDAMPSLLLVGRKEMYYTTSSNYTNGYVEISLDEGKISGSFREPGKGTPTSIDSYDSYVSSLGKKTVNHIFQTPKALDEKMTLFASTQQDGVWSYRDRGEGMQWNAEQ